MVLPMRYVNLGRSGLKISNVSLGSWLTYGNVIEQDVADSVIGRALEVGINLLDTADIYNRGGGEKALAATIRGRRREHLVIATKCFFPMSDDVNDRGLSRKHIVESLHQSLARLATDYVDLYQCHRPDPETPLGETVMAMDDLIRQGKILYWGVSLWPASLIVEAVQLAHDNGWHAPISNQPKYNLFDRDIEEEVIPASERCGIGQIVFSPLAQGVLTGKYRDGENPGADTRAGNDRVNQFIGPYLSASRLTQAQGLVDLAARFDLRPAQVALAWCLRQPNVNSVIIGASRVEQLEENVAAADLELAPELLQQLEDLFPG